MRPKTLEWIALAVAIMALAVGCRGFSVEQTRSATTTWGRETFDGHTYVIRHGDGYGGGSGISHDPDCPCGRGK